MMVGWPKHVVIIKNIYIYILLCLTETINCFTVFYYYYYYYYY